MIDIDKLSDFSLLRRLIIAKYLTFADNKKEAHKTIKYKINVLEELKKAGYNSAIIREKNLLSQGTVQNIKEGK